MTWQRVILCRRMKIENHLMKRPKLSALEIQIIKLICKQMTAHEIGLKLGFGKRTIEGYRSEIIKKVGAKNVVGVVAYAFRQGIVS